MTDILKVILIEKKELAKDTWQFIFKRPKDFSFLPGQYITMFLGKETRDFTIASNSLDKEKFSIVTKLGTSLFKRKLFSLKKGLTIEIKRPAGGFTLNEKDTTEHVLLAGGIGVNVFYSMITHAHQKKIKTPITLFVSFSKRENMIYYDELMEVAQKNKNMRVIYSLSQDIWEGEKGRISMDLLKKYVPHFTSIKYLIAGGEKMVEDVQEMLLKSGVKEEKIRIDIFTGY